MVVRANLKTRLWMLVLQGKSTRGKETATEIQKPSRITSGGIVIGSLGNTMSIGNTIQA